MLQSIRDKTSGWIAYLIVFLISIPFALWGVNSYFGGGELAPAATVNGVEVTAQNLDVAYANYRRRLAEVFGGTIPEAFNDESTMKNQVLTQLIEETALRSYSESHRYRIGDQQLNEIIRSMDVFQRDGVFDPEIYQRQVRSLGYSTAGFEQELRRSQAMAQLQTAISITAFTVPEVGEKLSSLSNQTRDIRVLTSHIDVDDISISEDEINQHFEDNAKSYMTDEQVKIDYIEISLAAIKASIEIDEEQVRAKYEENRNAFTSDEIRTASHILLTLNADASEEESRAVKEKLQDIRAQLDAGAAFAELAKLHSQDPVSAAEGGVLGEVERGMMVQPFETVLFDLNVGDISNPVKTSFGWHLIQLNGVEGGDVQSFDELRDELADGIKSEMAESQIYDLTDNLANIAYEQPDSLEPAAEQLGLVLQTSDWFSRFSGEGIAAETKIRTAAFSPDVFNERRNSEAIELPGSRVVYIHLNDLKPAVSRQLGEVRDQIITELKRHKSREENLAKGKAALEGLNSGQSMESVASDWNVEITNPGIIDRSSTIIDTDLVKLAFTMPRPDGSSVFQGFEHANGDYSLVELTAVNTTQHADSSKEQLKSLTTATAGQEYQSVLKLLASRAEVVRTPLSELE